MSEDAPASSLCAILICCITLHPGSLSDRVVAERRRVGAGLRRQDGLESVTERTRPLKGGSWGYNYVNSSYTTSYSTFVCWMTNKCCHILGGRKSFSQWLTHVFAHHIVWRMLLIASSVRCVNCHDADHERGPLRYGWRRWWQNWSCHQLWASRTVPGSGDGR